MKSIDLSLFNNSDYQPGPLVKRILWYFTSRLIFMTHLPFPSVLKVKLLRLFGAKIGEHCVVKPSLNIKYPWFLQVGNYCWIGEGVWIDNLANVRLDHHVTLSQDAYLLTGSHDYKKTSFDLLLGEIHLEEGVWIGAKGIVCPGVRCKSHSVLAVGSVATSSLEAFTIYQGNPALAKRQRIIQ